MSTNKGTSINDQNNLLKKKWGGNTAEYDINNAVNNFAKNLEEFNAANTLQQRKDELNALYGGNILNYKSGADVYADYKRDLDQINTFDSYASALQQRQDAAKQDEAQKVQYVDTRRQLMQKYLPETLMAQGVANTGYTADALLKAENNYNQYVLGAMNERAQSEQNAMQDYQNALNTYKMQRADQEYQDFLAQQEKEEVAKGNEQALYSGALESIANNAGIEYVMEQLKAGGASEETMNKVQQYYDAELKKARDELYQELRNTSGTWSKEYLDSVRNILGDKHYNSLLTYEYAPANSYAGADVKVSNMEGSGGKGRDLEATPDENDVFRVTLDGTNYKLKTSSKAIDSSEAVYRYGMKNAKSGQVFLYDGKLYVRNGNAVQSVGTGKDYDTILKYLSSKASTHSK